MSNFNDGAPRTPKEWLEQGHDIVPCLNKEPKVKAWTTKENYVLLDEWNKKYFNHQIGLILNGKTDFDIDNHFINRFVGKYLKSCGAIYGRKSNPLSHYLFNETLKSYKFEMPKEFESYYKDFPHGNCLCEIRSGGGHQSIVPGSKINNEKVEWNNFSGIKNYDGDLKLDISKIALSGALTILYPSKGSRDDYCTAIAGVLSKHTNWNVSDIDEFVYFISVASEDEESGRRMSKGTTSKEKTFGMPKLAEILGCNIKTIAQLFSWVGVADNGSCFTDLKVFESEPKYWKLKYKDTWITIMDSSMLLSYTKMSILILENCYEVAPVITPKDWKEIVRGLLQNVKKIEVPMESSYYNSIGLEIIEMLARFDGDTDKENSFGGLSTRGVWTNTKDNCLYTRLENITNTLINKRMSYERRKLIDHMREKMGAEHLTINVRKKDIRVWKFSRELLNLRNHQDKGVAEHVRKKAQEGYEKTQNVF